MYDIGGSLAVNVFGLNGVNVSKAVKKRSSLSGETVARKTSRSRRAGSKGSDSPPSDVGGRCDEVALAMQGIPKSVHRNLESDLGRVYNARGGNHCVCEQ